MPPVEAMGETPGHLWLIIGRAAAISNVHPEGAMKENVPRGGIWGPIPLRGQEVSGVPPGQLITPLDNEPLATEPQGASLTLPHCMTSNKLLHFCKEFSSRKKRIMNLYQYYERKDGFFKKKKKLSKRF